MHGMEYFKTTEAQQARLINNYKNTKYKLFIVLVPPIHNICKDQMY